MAIEKIKVFYVSFEGDPTKDQLTKFRRVSGDKLKPMDHNDEIRELVLLKDVLPLVEAADKLTRSKWFTAHENDWDTFELLKFRISLWRDIIIRKAHGL